MPPCNLGKPALRDFVTNALTGWEEESHFQAVEHEVVPTEKGAITRALNSSSSYAFFVAGS
jgi:hypothetical protein